MVKFSRKKLVIAIGMILALAAGSSFELMASEIGQDNLTEQLTGKLGKSFAKLDSVNFEVVHDSDVDEATRMARFLELLNGQFRDLFQKKGFKLSKPEETMTWVSFKELDDFKGYARKIDRINLGGIKGYYSARTNRVAVVKPSLGGSVEYSQSDGQLRDSEIMAMAADEDNGLVKVRHEAIHQLAFNSGLQKRRVMYPLWLSEGLATYLENGIYQTDNQVREDRLVRLYKEGRLIPLNHFATVAGLTGDNDQARDMYAQAWGFFKFMFEHNPKSLKAYLENLYESPVGWKSNAQMISEFTEAFGSLEDANAAWMTYLRELSSKSS